MIYDECQSSFMKHNLQLQPKPKLEHKVMAESYAGPGQQNIMAHTATHGQVMATAKSLLCEEDIKQTASQKEGHHEAKRGASKQPRRPAGRQQASQQTGWMPSAK